MRITVVGLGGIGSNLAPWVARFLSYLPGAHTLTLVDRDEFEDRNRERQSFVSMGNKAQSVAQRLAQEFSHFAQQLTIDAMPEYVCPDTAPFILLEDEIVLLCVDNHATRKFVSDYARKLRNVSIISGGNEDLVGNVAVYLRRDGTDATPPLTHNHPEIETPNEKAPYEMSCEERAAAGAPQFFGANLNAAVCMYNMLFRLVMYPDGFVSEQKGDGVFQVETAYTEAYFDAYRNRVMSRREILPPGAVVLSGTDKPEVTPRDTESPEVSPRDTTEKKEEEHGVPAI